jgi:NAD(P)-dependent dehydrogenase (short-subunit alcohol dehydrogenase family)
VSSPVTLITGGGAGIGKAVALRLAADGHYVLIAEIDDARSSAVVSEIERSGGKATAFHLDVGDVAATRTVIAEMVEQVGQVDGLVNNAGVTRMAAMFDIEPADFDWMFNVNSRGAFFVMQAIARHMVERKAGRIVNLASIAAKGYRGVSNIVYAATKGSIISMTRVGSLELAPHGVTMNAICPGPTRTEIFREVVESVGEEAVARVRGLIPLGRLNDPADIAAMAAFLLSEDARNITGQCINVDGGIVYD